MSIAQEMNSDPYDVQRENFCSNIIRMLENKSDVIIECEGKEFHVHKFILVASSDYFKMFESNFQDSSTNKIKFPTITQETMKTIIDFIYLSRIPLPTDSTSLMHIIKGANLLEIKALVDHCSKKIVQGITVNNYPDIWKFIDQYENSVMTSGILDFLIKNLKNVMTNNQFLVLTDNNIMVLIKKINELKIKAKDYMFEIILKWIKLDKSRNEHVEKFFVGFNQLDLSNDYINTLIHKEPLITENAKILLKFSRYQTEKFKALENKNSNLTC